MSVVLSKFWPVILELNLRLNSSGCSNWEWLLSGVVAHTFNLRKQTGVFSEVQASQVYIVRPPPDLNKQTNTPTKTKPKQQQKQSKTTKEVTFCSQVQFGEETVGALCWSLCSMSAQVRSLSVSLETRRQPKFWEQGVRTLGSGLRMGWFPSTQVCFCQI
jgi:hypothetical protein